MSRFLGFYRLFRKFGVRKCFKAFTRLPSYFRYYMRLFVDTRTPIAAKALLVGTILYLLSPLDFVPDVIPFLGEMDDLALLVFALGRFTAMCPVSLRAEHEVACGLAEPIRVAHRVK